LQVGEGVPINQVGRTLNVVSLTRLDHDIYREDSIRTDFGAFDSALHSSGGMGQIPAVHRPGTVHQARASAYGVHLAAASEVNHSVRIECRRGILDIARKGKTP
jgi:hypothetical protein